MEEMKLIGMHGIKKEIAKILACEKVYQKTNARIPHFIIMLDAGNGQTYVTEAITDVLVDHALRDFHGIDEYLEYKTDGTLANIKWIFSDIDDNAIYDNEYKGVVAMDISKMAGVQNEYQMKYFEEKLVKVAETATIILYCATTLGRRGETLIRRVSNSMKDVRMIEPEAYTAYDLAEMILQNILERGILVADEEKMVKLLEEFVQQSGIKTAKNAVAIAERLVFYADYSKAVPVLSLGETGNFKKNFCMEA